MVLEDKKLDILSVETVDQLNQLLSEGLNIDEEKGGVTPLMWAIAEGKSEIAKELIKNKANINVATNKTGCTALHVATEFGNLELIQLLVEANANLEAREKILNATPLYFASHFDQLAAAKKLVELGADLEGASLSGVTPLLIAAHKSYDIVDFLLEKNANVNCSCSRTGVTALIAATGIGDLKLVRRILRANPSNINAQEIESGATALYAAVQRGFKDIANLLIESNADVNLCSVHNCSPLFVASLQGNLEIAKLLVEAKADVNIKTKKGFSALAAAAEEESNLPVFEYLLSAGGVVSEILPIPAALLLTHLMKSDKEELFDKLVGQSIKLDGSNPTNGFTLLLEAITSANVKYVKKLLDAGADVEQAAGAKPMHAAVVSESKNEEMVDLLLEKGAKLDVMTEEEVTPLMLASQDGYLSLVKKFVARNVNVNDYSEKEKRSSLILSVAYEHWDIVDFYANLHFDKKIKLDIARVNRLGETVIHTLVRKICLYKSDVAKESHSPEKINESLEKIKQLLLKLLNHEDIGNVLTVVGSNGATVLMLATLTKDIELTTKVLEILKQTGTLREWINFQFDSEENVSMKGTFPLYNSALQNNTEMCKLLTNYGADIDLVAKCSGVNTIFAAVQFDNRGIVELLYNVDKERREANPDGRPGILNQMLEDGSTLLSIAAREGHNDMIRFLLGHSVQVNVPGAIPPVILAANRGHIETVQLLVESGADIELKHPSNDVTAIYIAIKPGNESIFKYLLSKGANIDFQWTVNGYSPLMAACELNLPSFVRLILESFPADKQEEKKKHLDLKEKSGATAFHFAVENIETVQLLVEHSADVNCLSALPTQITPLLSATVAETKKFANICCQKMRISTKNHTKT